MVSERASRGASRGASSLASRFGSSSPTKRALGVTDAELRCLIAVASAERAEGGHPTRYAIQQITKGGSSNLPSNLCAIGLLVPVDRTEDRLYTYGLARAGRELVARALEEGRESA